jgi:hypothetical protein
MSQQTTNVLNEIAQEVTLCFNSLDAFFASLAGNYGMFWSLATSHSG